MQLLAAAALSDIAPTSAEIAAKAVPVLIVGLADPAVQYRYEAAEALGKWGSLAASAKPALEKLLQDPQDAVRDAAAAALKKIGG